MSDPLETLRLIQLELVDLNKQLSALANANHVPRRENDPRQMNVLTARCDADCPTCALELQIGKRISMLGEPQRAAFVENARNSIAKQREQRARASRPRNRSPSLWKRGFKCVLSEIPDITAVGLLELLDGMERTFDDENVALYLVGNDVVIEDLITRQSKTVKRVNLRTYLRRARNT